MNRQMSLMGVGGKIAIILLIAVITTAGISYWCKHLFTITSHYQQLIPIAVVMAIVGFSLNLLAAISMIRAHRKGQLATGGFYALFLHPMYTFQLLITVPGLLLLFNSWLVLLSIIPAFMACKAFAKEEEQYLEDRFGDQYNEYKRRVLLRFL